MDVICEVHVNSLLFTPFSVTRFVNASTRGGGGDIYTIFHDEKHSYKNCHLFREGISGSLKVL